MRVMIIDDSDTSRRDQRDVLAQLGLCDVAETSDTVEALDLDAANPADLLIIDRELPGEGGIGFVAAYRRRGGAAPVIMLSTEAERSAVVEALRAGVSDYLLKPLTPDLFSQRIGETLQRARAA